MIFEITKDLLLSRFCSRLSCSLQKNRKWLPQQGCEDSNDNNFGWPARAEFEVDVSFVRIRFDFEAVECCSQTADQVTERKMRLSPIVKIAKDLSKSNRVLKIARF
eukprot:GABU01009309.1.p1 GENE.GABU01009309.1~~GABU01009309.1.p1  ORF type:complete len:106 (+),score=4.08 GABU01009309.1:283-600(+)